MERKFALIVGNNEFEDSSLASLVSPASEARALAEVLKDPGIGGFDEVRALVNEPEAQVRRGIASLFARKSPDDLLLLYFSTHGLLDENGLLFLAARDTQRDLLDATSVEAAFVTKVMNNSLSRRQVLILDCCHSGAFARGTKGALGASISTAAAFEGNGFGRWVLTATDSTQYAWDGDKAIRGGDSPPSVFTRHLIEGLRTGAADEDDDGQISLDELYDYVYRKVLSETPRQTPGKWSYKQQGNLVIARNPYPGRKINLPDHLQEALESEFRSTREEAIRELQRYLNGPQMGLAKAAEQALEKISSEDDSLKVRRLAADVLASFRNAKGKHREYPLSQPDGVTRTEPSRQIEPKMTQSTSTGIGRGEVGLESPPEGILREPDGGAEDVSPVIYQTPSLGATQAAPPSTAEKKPVIKPPQAQETPHANPEGRSAEATLTKTLQSDRPGLPEIARPAGADIGQERAVKLGSAPMGVRPEPGDGAERLPPTIDQESSSGETPLAPPSTAKATDKSRTFDYKDILILLALTIIMLALALLSR